MPRDAALDIHVADPPTADLSPGDRIDFTLDWTGEPST